MLCGYWPFFNSNNDLRFFRPSEIFIVQMFGQFDARNVQFGFRGDQIDLIDTPQRITSQRPS
uniref:Uncharacterized protein n=1 Tax=Romanomermis culicivorax TaxID=13658 RepID=A0A915KKN5_ROMCU